MQQHDCHTSKIPQGINNFNPSRFGEGLGIGHNQDLARKYEITIIHANREWIEYSYLMIYLNHPQKATLHYQFPAPPGIFQL